MDGHAVSCIPAVADCYGALALELGGVPTQALAVIVGTGLREQAVGDFGDVLAASTREVGAGMHAEFATAVETEEPGRLASAFLSRTISAPVVSSDMGRTSLHGLLDE